MIPRLDNLPDKIGDKYPKELQNKFMLIGSDLYYLTENGSIFVSYEIVVGKVNIFESLENASTGDPAQFIESEELELKDEEVWLRAWHSTVAGGYSDASGSADLCLVQFKERFRK